jgi:Uma2 family endonuclease
LENKVTVYLLAKGSYQQTVFIKNQQIISMLFPELNLTVQELLLA